MPASGIKLADANVWLALAFSDHLHHPIARDWFNGQDDGAVVFCRVTQLALLRHLTNSKIMGKFVQSQQDAWLVFDKLVSDSRVAFLAEPPGLEVCFRDFSKSEFPAHEHWTDAYLAAFAMASRSQLVTFDTGFRGFQGLDLQVLGQGK